MNEPLTPVIMERKPDAQERQAQGVVSMSDSLAGQVLAYLREHNTMTIATRGPEGPWAASVFYASDRFDLYFLSAPDSLHSVNIHADPQVSVTVSEDYHDWRKIKGIQLLGEARVLEAESEIATATAVYVEKYPFTAKYLKLLLSRFGGVVKYLEKVLERVPFAPDINASAAKFYKVTPRRVYFVDNEHGLGKRREVELD